MDVYTERGKKRAFAGSIEWPGWCRSGRDEAAALEALIAYAPRYAEALGGSPPGFQAPMKLSDLRVVERLAGDATTDFGAPGAAPTADRAAIDARELPRLRSLMEACWLSFDRMAQSAEGKDLRRGPRGGGRELDSIVEHVVGAEAGYVTRLAARRPRVAGRDARDVTPEVRDAVLDALERAVNEGLPEAGPRGGAMWSPRYFVRRAAWHVLDHAWEIEDRSSPAR